MRASQISVGAVYLAKVSGRIVKVRVETIDHKGYGYTVRNLSTNRVLRFRTAGKLRPLDGSV